jgi:transcriptional regulator with XRE-family HTH domain
MSSRELQTLIGNRINAERERLGFNLEQFANLLDTTKKTIIDYQTGKSTLKATQLNILASAGFDIIYIITGLHTTYLDDIVDSDESLVINAYRKTKQNPQLRSAFMAFVTSISNTFSLSK